MLKLSLYENAFDSICHGLYHLEIGVSEQSKSDYKSAILLLLQGVELIMKELVCQKNLIYIFDKNSLFEKCQDWQNPTLEELYNCKSLEITKIYEIAKKFYPQIFNKETDRPIAEGIKLRNKVQHFSFEVDYDQVKSILLRVVGKVLLPSLTVIAKGIQDRSIKDPLGERLEQIFCCSTVASQEERALKLLDIDFARGSCFACRNYSLFIVYGVSYPERCYCTSCGYNRSNIDVSEFLECPECGAFSLLYCEELEGGICLWYKCANHKDGGVLTPIEWCLQCNSHRIEDQCKCLNNEE